MYVKIRQGPQQALAETVYYRTAMPFEFAMRWRWYFEYRAALFRVARPRYFTEIVIGSYEPDPRSAQQVAAASLKNRITRKKGMITEKERLLATAKAKWTSFFPIEQDKLWPAAVAKISTLKTELEAMEAEHSRLIDQVLNTEKHD